MAGHSHWAGIKRKKEAEDAKRGKIFSRLAKLITTAARLGGGDPTTNTRLSFAIEQARQANMPKDNIERAIKKGTGELGKDQILELTYECYGPGGVAILVEAVTDNRNRTGSEIRNIVESAGGSLGGSNSVNYMFDKKGLIMVDAANVDEDQLTEIALEGGAEDLELVGDAYQITCAPEDFSSVREALKDAGIQEDSAEFTNIPNTSVPVDESTGRKIIALLEKLEEHDDVEGVSPNVELPEALLTE